MEPRSDPFHKLIFVYKGETAYDASPAAGDGPLGPGDLVLVPASRRHALRDLRPATLFLLCLDPGFVAGDAEIGALWKEVVASGRLRRSVDVGAGSSWARTWRRMIAEQQGRLPGSGVALRAEAGRLLVLFARSERRRESPAARQRVAAVLARLEDSFFEEWDLDGAAGRAGVSRRRFSQLCRELTGKSFLENLTERRLAHAALLLRSGGHTITGAAFSSGFPDLSHFYRVFRRHFGCPPGAWLQTPGAAAPPIGPAHSSQ